MRKRGISFRIFAVGKPRFLLHLLTKKVIWGVLALTLILSPFEFNYQLTPISYKLSHAAPNYQINYQGKLTDSSDTAVTNGDYDIVFNLYTAPTGGVAIWTESHTGANDVTVTNGLFSVMLGSITSLSSISFNQPLYLGITIEADSEMTPRKLLGAVPAAFESDKLDGLDSTDFLSTSTASAPNLWSLTGLGNIGSSTATTTILGNLAATGVTIINNILSVYNHITAPYFTATSTTQASTFPYASTTAITTSGTASTTNLIVSNTATIGSLTGILEASSGVVSTFSTSQANPLYFNGTTIAPTSSPTFATFHATSTTASSTAGVISLTKIVTSATSTGTNGFDISAGCYAIAGVCISGGGGSGTVSSGLAGQLAYYASDGTTLTGTTSGNITAGRFTATSSSATSTLTGGLTVASSSLSVLNHNGYVGIKSSNPASPLYVNANGLSSDIQSRAITISGDASDGDQLVGLRIFNVVPLVNQRSGIELGGYDNTVFNRIYSQLDSGGTFADLYFNYGSGATKTGVVLVGDTGNVGIGTTSPYARLSVVGQAVAEYFTATSTTATSTFAAPVSLTKIVTSATSTGTNGFDISAGCYAIAGTCISGGGGSGTVSSGLAGQLAYYAADGTTVSGTTTGVITGGTFVATTSTASILPYASTTALTVSGSAASLVLPSGQLAIGTTTGGWQINTYANTDNSAAPVNTIGVGLNISNASSVEGSYSAIRFEHPTTGDQTFIQSVFKSNNRNALIFGGGGGVDNVLTLDIWRRETFNYSLGLGTTTPGSMVAASPFNNSAPRTIEAVSNGTSQDSAISVLRSDGLSGADIWQDGGGADVYFDSRANSDTANIFFRTKTYGTAVNALSILGSGYVGIGTTTVSDKLTVEQGNLRFNYAQSTGTDGTFGYIDWAQTMGIAESVARIEAIRYPGSWDYAGLRFFTANGTIAERMRISDVGSVGIGTTSPSANYKLSVAGGNVHIGGNITSTSTVASVLPYASSTGLTVSGSSYFASSGGNVGIGTALPAGLLDVYGSSAGGTVNVYFRNQTTNTSNSRIALNLPVFNGTSGLTIEQMVASGGGFSVGTYDALISTGQAGSYLHFAAGSGKSPQISISPSGNLGIGTTTPGATLGIQGDIFLAGRLISTSTTATSTFAAPVSATKIVTSATSTGTNGFDISAGCFAINGTCISGGGSGSGTVGSGTTGQIPYYAATGTALTATSSVYITTDGRVGIGGGGVYTPAPSYESALQIFPWGAARTNFPTYNTNNTNERGLAVSVYKISTSTLNDVMNIDFAARHEPVIGNDGSQMRFLTQTISSAAPSLALLINRQGSVSIGGSEFINSAFKFQVGGTSMLAGNLYLTGDINTATSSTGLNTNISLSTGSGGTAGTVKISTGSVGDSGGDGNPGGVGGVVYISDGGNGYDDGASQNGGNAGTVYMVRGGAPDGGSYGNDGTLNIGNSAGQKNATVNLYGTLNVMFRNTATTNGVCHSGTDLDSTDTTNTYSLVACSAAPGDIAEFYPIEAGVEAGDIVATTDQVISYEAEGADPLTGQIKSLGEQELAVLKRAKSGDVGVLGVISTGPFQTFGKDINKAGVNTKPVALVGRVPVKVSLENGPIKPGDQITLSATTPGVGMRAGTSSPVTIGTALTKFDDNSNKDSNGVGKINVFVDLSRAKLSSAISGDSLSSGYWSLDETTGQLKAFAALDLAGQNIENVGAIKSASGRWSISADGQMLVDGLQVNSKATFGRTGQPIGLTLFDQVTGEPYCLVIKNGEVESLAGECGLADESDTTDNNPQPSPSTPEPETPDLDPEPVEDEVVEEEVADENGGGDDNVENTEDEVIEIENEVTDESGDGSEEENVEVVDEELSSGEDLEESIVEETPVEEVGVEIVE